MKKKMFCLLSMVWMYVPRKAGCDHFDFWTNIAPYVVTSIVFLPEQYLPFSVQGFEYLIGKHNIEKWADLKNTCWSCKILFVLKSKLFIKMIFIIYLN